MLFVVSEDETNVYDQRYLENAVRRKNPNIKVIRRSIQALQRNNATLGKSKELLVLVWYGIFVSFMIVPCGNFAFHYVIFRVFDFSHPYISFHVFEQPFTNDRGLSRGPFLLTRFNYNPSMDKKLHPS